MGKSSSPPPTPDYVGAAQQQGVANQETARTTSRLSNPSISNPYGTRYVEHGTVLDANGRSQISGNPDDTTIIDRLSPEQQKLYDGQNQISQQLLDVGNRGLYSLSDTLSKPMDTSSAQAATDKAYGQITSRLDPQFDRSQTSLETQLTNQGLRPGSEAWGNAMKDFNYGKNDAYTQARTQAQQFAPQTMQMDMAGRDHLLNELNALRTGSQVQNPQFQAFQGSTVGQTPIFGAAQAQGQADMGLYNLQQANNNSQTQGMVGLAMAAATAY